MPRRFTGNDIYRFTSFNSKINDERKKVFIFVFLKFVPMVAGIQEQSENTTQYREQSHRSSIM